jgi:hypothetical protein
MGDPGLHENFRARVHDVTWKDVPLASHWQRHVVVHCCSMSNQRLKELRTQDMHEHVD